jgi:glycosyltransferase involved in cell wall biosynthesis
MTTPLVSVIIPTYNGASFIGRAIQSVLDQTYQNFELIIVDDKSPDNTEEVVKQFDDPRVKYIRHENNQGASGARWTAINNSSGEIVAFLDQDDFFHQEKLEAHVDFLGIHPEVGFTYNPYFEMVHSSVEKIRTVWQPPKHISLTELTLGFYLPPSAWVVRREWVAIEEIWSGPAMRGREITVCGRLFMSGCKFARVDRVLHYRCYHGRRIVKNLEKSCKDELTCQEIIFSDPRCPAEVANMRPMANAVINGMWANVAFTQNETELGKKFLWDSAQVNPFAFMGSPSPFMNFLMGYCVDDESYDYETLLDRIVSQLPSQTPDILPNYLWAVSRGNYFRGVRALIWDRQEDAKRYFSEASKLSFTVDDAFVQQVTHELVGYQMANGIAAAKAKLSLLASHLGKYLDKRSVNWLKGSYLVNIAGQDYREGQLGKVPSNILAAIANRSKYLVDRGSMAILVKSLLGVKPTLQEQP